MKTVTTRKAYHIYPFSMNEHAFRYCCCQPIRLLLARYIQAAAMLTHGSDLGNAQLEYGMTRAASSIVREFYGRPSVRFPMSRR